jgi:hypothetical protein
MGFEMLNWTSRPAVVTEGSGRITLYAEGQGEDEMSNDLGCSLSVPPCGGTNHWLSHHIDEMLG